MGIYFLASNGNHTWQDTNKKKICSFRSYNRRERLIPYTLPSNIIQYSTGILIAHFEIENDINEY